MFRRHQEVVARNGHTLIVGIVARISGCDKQKEMSLDDQVDNAREAIEELYQGPVEYKTITTVAKGERLDRPELEEIETALYSSQFDCFVFDDLSRLIRGGEAARLLGVGVDHVTRSLCL
jgi:site-specific DNA recombinase